MTFPRASLIAIFTTLGSTYIFASSPFPSQPINIVVTVAPGGGIDVSATTWLTCTGVSMWSAGMAMRVARRAGHAGASLQRLGSRVTECSRGDGWSDGCWSSTATDAPITWKVSLWIAVGLTILSGVQYGVRAVTNKVG